MNRVINEVLPTDCSPRNTSLNFRRGFWKEDSAMMETGLVNRERKIRRVAEGREGSESGKKKLESREEDSIQGCEN